MAHGCLGNRRKSIMFPLTEYQDAFRLFDKNKDNRICVEELRNVMNILGQYPTNNEIRALIKGIDSDGKPLLWLKPASRHD